MDTLSVIRHWLVFPGPEISQAAEIVTDAEDADAAKGAGHRVEGPFVPADQLAGAVAERDAFARALTIAVASPELREAYVRQAKDSLTRERGQ
jgi:hypothetical protein